MEAQVIISVEQALTMTYATQRCVQLGWRVIRVEPTPVPDQKSKGDPNRYVGRTVAGEDRCSYFISTNVGKEAIAIDLKQEEGQDLLKRLIRDLDADIFCNNTMPARHDQLGIDYATLRNVKQDLIWCCVSAMGLAYPKVPGYDPVMQALCGYMDLTGHPEGPPLQCGVPLVDLKAGDEAFVQMVLALMEREQTAQGKQIDISMAQVAVSWLHTFLPMLDMGSPSEELRRSGNQHRQFIPVNAYRTKDVYIYMAIGSDAQWHRFVQQPMFLSLDQKRFSSNQGRRSDGAELHGYIDAITRQHSSAEVSRALTKAGVPHSPITPIEKVYELPFVAESALRTETPHGQTVRLPPPACSTPFLRGVDGQLRFAPAYGEHTDGILSELGLTHSAIGELRRRGVVA